MTGEEIEVVVDGMSWSTVSEWREYDAVHAVAGALLAGADTVVVRRNGADLPDVDHDVDKRFAEIRVTVGGDDYTDVVREKERMTDLPPDVDVYVDRVEARDGTVIMCGCGEYGVEVPERKVPDVIDVVCPECGNHFGHQ